MSLDERQLYLSRDEFIRKRSFIVGIKDTTDFGQTIIVIISITCKFFEKYNGV